MKREVESNFNGILNIKDQENVHQAFFHGKRQNILCPNQHK